MSTPTKPKTAPKEPRFRPFLTVNEVAQTLGVTQWTIYRYLKRGIIPHHRVGRLYRVRISDLAVFRARYVAGKISE